MSDDSVSIRSAASILADAPTVSLVTYLEAFAASIRYRMETGKDRGTIHGMRPNAETLEAVAAELNRRGY